MYIALYGKVKDLESRMGVLEKAFDGERDRTDQRIFEKAKMAREVLEVAKEVLKQSQVLTTTVEVLIRERHDS
jgi:hypothetical protein